MKSDVATTIMVTLSGHPAKMVNIARDIDSIFRNEGYQINIVELPRSASLEGVRPVCITIEVYTTASQVSKGLRDHLHHIRWQLESFAPSWHLFSSVFIATHWHRHCRVVRGNTPD